MTANTLAWLAAATAILAVLLARVQRWGIASAALLVGAVLLVVAAVVVFDPYVFGAMVYGGVG
jgi:hypothetical protein